MYALPSALCRLLSYLQRGRVRGSWSWLSPSDSGLGIVLHSLFMSLTFPLDFGHHGFLLRGVCDMATLHTLIASRLFRVGSSARLWLHRVENVKRIIITVKALQAQPSVHQLRLLPSICA